MPTQASLIRALHEDVIGGGGGGTFFSNGGPGGQCGWAFAMYIYVFGVVQDIIIMILHWQVVPSA